MATLGQCFCLSTIKWAYVLPGAIGSQQASTFVTFDDAADSKKVEVISVWGERDSTDRHPGRLPIKSGMGLILKAEGTRQPGVRSS